MWRPNTQDIRVDILLHRSHLMVVIIQAQVMEIISTVAKTCTPDQRFGLSFLSGSDGYNVNKSPKHGVV